MSSRSALIGDNAHDSDELDGQLTEQHIERIAACAAQGDKNGVSG